MARLDRLLSTGDAPGVEALAREAARAREDALARKGRAGRDRGIVHTPPELARFVVERLDRALRRDLGLPLGLADPRVAILDPACGPGAFLAAVVACASGRGGRPVRAVGIDVDEAAIAAAETVLRPHFDSAGFPLELRAGDGLADVAPFGELPGSAVIVVLGNPPWASRTWNRGAATAGLLDDFRRDQRGVRLDERKLGVLSDDYVRFFRLAAEIVRRSPGGGALGLVTNGSFLDGRVHRGMRAALLSWLDRAEVLDLGGSALVARGRARDDNVFAVRPQVAVTIGVRTASGDERRRGRIRYSRLAGTRAEKLAALVPSAPSLPARTFRPVAPMFRFRPAPRASEYDAWPSLEHLFPFHAEGIQTNRDELVTDVDRPRLLARLRAIASGEIALAPLPHLDPAAARERLSAALERDPDGELGLVRRIAYRPFEPRHALALAPLCHRPRPPLLRAIDGRAPVLYAARQDRGTLPWACFGAGRDIPESSFLSSRSSCRTRAYPSCAPDGTPNVDALLAGRWCASVEQVLYWSLAVLASPTYRTRFDAALRLDHPRILPPPTALALERGVTAGRAVLAALEGSSPDGGAEVVIGHRTVCSSSLRDAFAHADDAIAPWIGSS